MDVEYIENNLDYDTYYSLRKSVGWKNFSEKQTRQAIKNTMHSIVVKEQTQAVAMARLVGDGLYYMIVDVVVTPEYQRQGIGSKLLELLLNYVENNLPEGGRVSIQLVAEKGKEEFYEHFGFKRIPHEFCGSGMRKVIYKRVGE